MVQDLSYIHETPTEELHDSIRQAVEEQCLKAIINYLTEVADTMVTNEIEALNADALRAMAATLTERLNALLND